MRNTGWLLTIPMTLAALVGVAIGDDAKDYTPKNERYTITLPAGEMSERTKVVPLTDAAPGKSTIKKGKIIPPSRNPTAAIEVAHSKNADGTLFTAASIGIPAVIIREIPEEKRMQTYRDIVMVHVLKGKLVSEKEIKQGDWPGKEYLIEYPKGNAKLQLFMYGGFGFFACVEAANEERLAAKDVQDFYKSFKLKAKD